MQISENIIYCLRLAGRAARVVRGFRTSILVAFALSLGLASAARADIIELERFVTAKEKMPVLLVGQVTSFSFDVPAPPTPGPISKHGAQHYYFDTRVKFTVLTADTGGPKALLTPQDLGFMTMAVTVNQSFDTAELIEKFSPSTSIKDAFITVIDYYQPRAVPEPAQWALMILGFAAAGATMRRPARKIPAFA